MHAPLYRSLVRTRTGKLVVRYHPTPYSIVFSVLYAYGRSIVLALRGYGRPWRCYACGSAVLPVPRANALGTPGRYKVGACAAAPCGNCCKGCPQCGPSSYCPCASW